MSDIEMGFDQIPFGTDDFADNPEPRCPLLLLLDTSGSMRGSPVSELNAGLVTLKDQLASDHLASKRVEVAIITFGPIETSLEFTTVNNFFPPQLKAQGDTPMGAAISQGIDMLESRKTVYRNNGISYYRPWIMLITDGGPTDRWAEAAARVKAGEESKAFSFFGIGVQDANMEILGQIAVRQPLKLRGLQFREFFVWLSNSMRAVSQSTVGDVVPLTNPATPFGWAEV